MENDAKRVTKCGEQRHTSGRVAAGEDPGYGVSGWRERRGVLPAVLSDRPRQEKRYLYHGCT